MGMKQKISNFLKPNYNSLNCGFMINPYSFGGNLTYSNNFSTDNMTHTDSGKTNISGGVFNFTQVADGTNDTAYWDLGSSLSNTAWVIRNKLQLTSITGVTGNPNGCGRLCMHSTTSSMSNAQDFLGIGIENIPSNSNLYAQFAGDGLGSEGMVSSFTRTQAIETVYWESTRLTATTFKSQQFSDSNYSSSLEVGATDTISSGITDLRYWAYKNRVITNGSLNVVGNVDNIEIYDGINDV